MFIWFGYDLDQSVTFCLLFGFSKYSIQVLNPLKDLMTSQSYHRSSMLFTSIKCFFHSPMKMIWFQKTSIPGVYYFSSMFQLYVACVFFTNGACMMALNTIPGQIPICGKVINGLNFSHGGQIRRIIYRDAKNWTTEAFVKFKWS